MHARGAAQGRRPNAAAIAHHLTAPYTRGVPPTRVNVIGASGVGKTTLGRALAQVRGCSYFDSDDYYHEPTDPPFRVPRAPQARREMVRRDLSPHASWVLSGMVAAWEPAPALDYTLVVFLYLPPPLRLARLRERERRLFGARIDAGGDMEQDHVAFMRWTEGYDEGAIEGTNTLRHHRAFAESVSCPVLELHAPATAAEHVDAVLAALRP